MMYCVPIVGHKPRWEWKFTPNYMGGTAASAYAADFYKGQIVIPKGATDEERDALLWAYELGWYEGKDCAEDRVRRAVKKFLNIYD